MNIDERYEHLEKVIKEPRFRQRRGLGNELPFFICPYPPAEAAETAERNKHLKDSLKKAGVRAREINLYALTINILKERDRFEDFLKMEPKVDKSKVLDFLRGILNPEKYLVPKIREMIDDGEYDVLFLTGIGEVYPYLRAHNVLNNLHSVCDDKPLIIFFPGEYRESAEDGTSLDLFGLLHDDRYYRAFNILYYQI